MVPSRHPFKGKSARGAARPLFSLPLARGGSGWGSRQGGERERTLRRPCHRTGLADRRYEKCGLGARPPKSPPV